MLALLSLARLGSAIRALAFLLCCAVVVPSTRRFAELMLFHF